MTTSFETRETTYYDLSATPAGKRGSAGDEAADREADRAR
jgi:hypothetical protein